jgi:hypothetical protein
LGIATGCIIVLEPLNVSIGIPKASGILPQSAEEPECLYTPAQALGTGAGIGTANNQALGGIDA